MTNEEQRELDLARRAAAIAELIAAEAGAVQAGGIGAFAGTLDIDAPGLLREAVRSARGGHGPNAFMLASPGREAPRPEWRTMSEDQRSDFIRRHGPTAPQR